MSVALKVKKRRKIVRPRVKLWLESDGESVLCGGMSEMLQAVDETGSLKKAAERVGRSYRYVWARIKEAEAALGATLVETRVGGSESHRSRLTPLAVDLLRDFQELRREIWGLVDKVFSKRVADTIRRHAH